jgi:hypothetical protein
MGAEVSELSRADHGIDRQELSTANLIEDRVPIPHAWAFVLGQLLLNPLHGSNMHSGFDRDRHSNARGEGQDLG